MFRGGKMETVAIDDHKYNLRWTDYHDTILSTFRYFRVTIGAWNDIEIYIIVSTYQF